MSWQKKLLTFLAILIIFGSITLIVLFSLNFIDNWGWILLSILWLYFINITFIIYIFYAKNRPDKENNEADNNLQPDDGINSDIEQEKANE